MKKTLKFAALTLSIFVSSFNVAHAESAQVSFKIEVQKAGKVLESYILSGPVNSHLVADHTKTVNVITQCTKAPDTPVNNKEEQIRPGLSLKMHPYAKHHDGSVTAEYLVEWVVLKELKKSPLTEAVPCQVDLFKTHAAKINGTWTVNKKAVPILVDDDIQIMLRVE
jgi:hypothetical protein